MRSREEIEAELNKNLKGMAPEIGQEFITLEVLRAVLDIRDLLLEANRPEVEKAIDFIKKSDPKYK